MPFASSLSARPASVPLAFGLSLFAGVSAFGCDDGPTEPSPSTPPRAPKSWYCEAALYAEVENGIAAKDAFCDCACGVYDPDCDVAGGDLSVANHEAVEDEPEGELDDVRCRQCVRVENSIFGGECRQ